MKKNKIAMTTRDKITLILLVLMSIFLYADQNVINPVIIELQKEYGVDKQAVGVIGSAFTLLGAIVTLVWGYYTDKVSRKKLLVATILLGEIPCFLTGIPYFTRTYNQLLTLRILTGIGVGGIVPLTFSLIGDYFSKEHRITANAWVGVAWAIGQILGQTMAGFLVSSYGWRLPFILAAVPNFILVPIFLFYAVEPKRGHGEEALKELLDEGAEYRERIKISDFAKIFRNKTNLFTFLQGVPGTVPWGVLPFFLVDYYRDVKNFPAEVATVLILIFGIGATIGGLVGGYIGKWLYKKDSRLLPVFAGSAVLIGIIPWYIIVAINFGPNPGWSDLIIPGLLGFVGGFICAIAGPVVKAILIEVNVPENRGSVFAIFNLTDSIGKGLGPFIGGALISNFSYQYALNFSITWWIPCGLLFFLIIPYINKDIIRINALMKSRAVSMKEMGSN